MPNSTFPPMIVTSFAAFYASSRSQGLKAFSTLRQARKKTRPALYLCRQKFYAVFAPTTSHSMSLNRQHFQVDRTLVPALDEQSYLDTQELWYVPTHIIPNFAKCFRFSVDTDYVRSLIYPMYLPLMNGLKAII